MVLAGYRIVERRGIEAALFEKREFGFVLQKVFIRTEFFLELPIDGPDFNPIQSASVLLVIQNAVLGLIAGVHPALGLAQEFDLSDKREYASRIVKESDDTIESLLGSDGDEHIAIRTFPVRESGSICDSLELLIAVGFTEAKRKRVFRGGYIPLGIGKAGELFSEIGFGFRIHRDRQEIPVLQAFLADWLAADHVADKLKEIDPLMGMRVADGSIPAAHVDSPSDLHSPQILLPIGSSELDPTAQGKLSMSASDLPLKTTAVEISGNIAVKQDIPLRRPTSARRDLVRYMEWGASASCEPCGSADQRSEENRTSENDPFLHEGES